MKRRKFTEHGPTFDIEQSSPNLPENLRAPAKHAGEELALIEAQRIALEAHRNKSEGYTVRVMDEDVCLFRVVVEDNGVSTYRRSKS